MVYGVGERCRVGRRHPSLLHTVTAMTLIVYSQICLSATASLFGSGLITDTVILMHPVILSTPFAFLLPQSLSYPETIGLGLSLIVYLGL